MYNFILEYFVLPIGDFFNKTSYIKQLRYWRGIDDLSEDELKQLQEKNLKALLNHATEHVSRYNSIELKGENPYKWIESFPILTKDYLRNNEESLLSKKVSKKHLIPYSSSGSSGVQSTVYMNKKEQSIIRGILTHWWEWSTYSIGSPIVQTGITPQRGIVKKLKDLLFKTTYINAFSHSEDDLKKICTQLNNTSTYFLAGYASSLNVIAEYALKNNYKIRCRGVISLGDKLFAHYRKNIEKTFASKVLDTYGSNEGLMIAAQKDLDYLYILSPHVYVEIVDDYGKPLPDGEMGHILVTRLDGFSMPLIRFKLGDLGIVLPKNKYPKDRAFNYPLLEKIVGRETDVITTTNGKKLVVHSFTGIFEYVPEIKQFKVIQKDRNGILIVYIKDIGFSKAVLQKITKELQQYIQDDTFQIEYEEVEEILPTKSGKPQIIESHLYG